MRNIKKILVHLKTGKKYLVKDLHDNYHTQSGVIKASEFRKSVLVSNKGDKFLCLEPNFVDLWENLNRGPQVINQKDIIKLNIEFEVVVELLMRLTNILMRDLHLK